jgi:hypothetical protein
MTKHGILNLGIILGVLAFSLCTHSVRSGEAEILKSLKEKGATVIEKKGVVSEVSIKDCKSWTDADFRQLGQLTRLKSLSFGPGLTDRALASLSGLTELERFGSNGMQVSDEGIKPLGQLKKLRSLALFHPGKNFSGSGLAHLANLPDLENLTVAGSFAFNDEGMAAVGKLTRLKNFRTWHAGQTNEGVKCLKNLKNLKSLWLGQRLSYKPPICPSDETLAILVELKSLEALQLDETRLTLTALEQLKQLPRLKKLTLGGIEITKADVERLRKALPAVEIKWTMPSDAYSKRIRALFEIK